MDYAGLMIARLVTALMQLKTMMTTMAIQTIQANHPKLLQKREK
jgi:hypothetical protein